MADLLSDEAMRIARRMLNRLVPKFEAVAKFDVSGSAAHPHGKEHCAYDFVRVLLPDEVVSRLERCTRGQLLLDGNATLQPGEMRAYLGTYFALSKYRASLDVIASTVRERGPAVACAVLNSTLSSRYRISAAVEILSWP